MLELLCYLAGIGTGILLALWTGHLARKRVSREQRRLAVLGEDLADAVFCVDDAVAMGLSTDTCAALRTDRDRAAAAYYAALKGEP